MFRPTPAYGYADRRGPVARSSGPSFEIRPDREERPPPLLGRYGDRALERIRLGVQEGRDPIPTTAPSRQVRQGHPLQPAEVLAAPSPPDGDDVHPRARL